MNGEQSVGAVHGHIALTATLTLTVSLATLLAVAGALYVVREQKKAAIMAEVTAGEGKKPRVTHLFVYPVKSCHSIEISQANVTPTGFMWDRQWMIADAASGRFISQRTDPKLALIRPHIPEKYLSEGWKNAPLDAVMTLSAPGMDDLDVPLSFRAYPSSVPASVWSWHGTALDCGAGADAWVSQVLGRPCKLLRFNIDHVTRPTVRKWAPDYFVTFNDLFAYMVVSETSVAALNALMRDPITFTRFRPNIVLEGAEPFEEDTWRAFVIGQNSSRIFRGVKPRGRCRISTTDQETGVVGIEPLRTLAETRSGAALGLPPELAREWNFGLDAVCDTTWLHPASGTVSVGDLVTVLDRAPSAAELPFSIVKHKKSFGTSWFA